MLHGAQRPQQNEHRHHRGPPRRPQLQAKASRFADMNEIKLSASDRTQICISANPRVSSQIHDPWKNSHHEILNLVIHKE